MGFELFPQNVTLFPSDRQLFTARAKLPPPMWQVNSAGVGAGVVQPDFSVRISQPGSSVGPNAVGAFQLKGGIGTIEWTIAPNCLPASGGRLTYRAILQAPGGSPWIYEVQIRDTSIRIFREGAVQLTELFITPTVGMRFKIEISSGFRLFINDVLAHSRTSLGAAVAYPGTYDASIAGTAPFVVTPPAAIPAPILSGAWDLSPENLAGVDTVSFSVEHGSLGAVASLLQKEYFNGTVPGSYKLIALIDPGTDVWVEDAVPAGASQSTSGGDAWNFVGSSPTPNSGTSSHKSNNVAGDHAHTFTGATTTLQIDPGDILYCWVFPDVTNPTTEIMLEWGATDATGFAHRAYWGANSLTQGANGTPTRRFIGSLPTAGQWTRLEVPASLVDLEGRTLNGMTFRLFNGVCSFDQAGKIPGRQRAESIINIPPLQILGELVRTLQPGAKFRPQTNYDVAQTPGIVTWSVVSGGGSFTAGEFTAPTTPGTSVLRASSTSNQVADLTINVPAVITPGFAFAAPLEQIDFNTNIPSPTWTSVPSGINSGTGAITFPNTPGATVRIQATNGTFTATRDVLIVPAFPFSDFTLPLSWDRNLSALISMSEDRTSRITREKAPPYDSYPVKLTSRTLADSNAVDAFFDAQGFGKPFILEDKVRGIRKVGWFDSAIRHEARDECDIDLSFQFLEARI